VDIDTGAGDVDEVVGQMESIARDRLPHAEFRTAGSAKGAKKTVARTSTLREKAR
jgi:hypothetical protein